MASSPAIPRDRIPLTGMSCALDDSKRRPAEAGDTIMSEPAPRRLGTLALELVVVFAGVLIALAAEASWETRKEIAREKAYVVALHSDMERAAVAVTEALAQIEEDLGVFDLLAQSIMRPGVDTGDASGMQLRVPTYVIPTGTLDALLASGEIQIVRSDTLRAVLIREHARLQTGFEALARYEDVSIQTFTKVSLARQELRVAGVPTLSLEDIRAHPQLSAAVIDHYVLLLNSRATLQEMIAAIQAVEAETGRALLEF